MATVDQALAAAVLEIESYAAGAGWDQPARLYALVDTARLVQREPALAAAIRLEGSGPPGSLTPVEQERLPAEQLLEEALPLISWPAEVSGCAAVVERLVLPPGADADLPGDLTGAEEVRIAAGVTRDGATYCALRLRAHDDDQSVLGGADLVPGLLALLGATLDSDEHEENPTG